ncbi:toll/interleukin-1 receptor domain-containing protein [Phototrophicus methaneseepsis]|uniref:Toll/interleukin-1 receptor domain-containing protein n=1 Tax=Phototrophicus methaneseepsis TaxID=2710758 RepID=A0A7S8E8D3_9CHLR|nr:toll/interleukin-1 receptor domain-containing protein [Phototrophicus methaneseepsis]QPC82270.1 toll/interleukin-1 receptor domain-containing protein [Phototrophicus methaneseepsis]
MNARITIQQMNEVFRKSPLIELNTRRIALRRILRKHPNDLKARDALQRTQQVKVVRLAAKDGVMMAFCKKDEAFATEVHTSLKVGGLRVWQDAFDGLDTDNWVTTREEAIEYNNVLLLILSEAALHDDNVMATYQSFWDSGKLIVPLLYKTCNIQHLNLYVEPIDFRQDMLAGFHRLMHMVRIPK